LTYILYNIVPFGLIVLLIYMFVDIFLDYFRKTQKEYKKRIFMFGFGFYLLSLLQIKLGGLTLPPQNITGLNDKFISTGDWFGIYNTLYFHSFYVYPLGMLNNIVLFIPFGIFLTKIFNVNRLNRLVVLLIFGCIGMELLHLLLEWFGFAMRTFNWSRMGVLVLNIFGGILGYLLLLMIRRRAYRGINYSLKTH